MRILLTGISSFTGYWFAKTMVAANHEVIGTTTGSLERYEGVRQRRVEQLRTVCRLVPQAPFGSETFLKLLREGKPCDLLCHHGAEATGYKSLDFDVHRAFLGNTLNLRSVLTAFREMGGKAVVLTGSVFENDEGLGDEPLRAFSPYGLSKGLTWEAFRYYCGLAGVPLGKFVIPNAFGPFEEERFTAYLLRTWQQRKPAAVKTPAYVRDNIPVDLLACVYGQFAERVAAGNVAVYRLNPSGYVESQGAFAMRVAREVRARLGWSCELELMQQQEFGEPVMRVNRHPALHSVPQWDERAAWDAFVAYYAPKV